MTLLKDKAIVITGAGNGLGRAYAILAASLGASVVVNDIDNSAAERVCREIRAGGGVGAPNADSVSTWEGSRRVIATCVDVFGRIDGLVNNAGISIPGVPWEETESTIRAMIEVNLLGTLFCGRHAMVEMRRAGSGSIVNVCSTAVWGTRSISTYGATKGGIASVTYNWALELADANIRVNAFSPNATTNIHDQSKKVKRLLGYADDNEERPAANERKAPAKPRPPETNAPVVAFLLSDLARGVTGQYIELRGGRLSIINRGKSHLEPNGVSAERNAWTIEVIGEAFENVFRPHLQPLQDYRAAV